MVKSIKCPKCGSGEKYLLRPDLLRDCPYHCLSCGYEFDQEALIELYMMYAPPEEIDANSDILKQALKKCDKFVVKSEESKMEKENDPVTHPSHYTQGKIECIDFIADKKLNFCRGNAVKYIIRAGLKDPSKEIEDLKKAVFYLNYEIAQLEKEGKK